MKVLLAYATYSSGTDLASQLVASVITKRDIAVDRKDVREVALDTLRDYDYIIFASPSWRTRKGDGQPHEFFLDFMDQAATADFTGMKIAVFGLGDTAYTHFGGAVDHLVEFVKGKGGELIGQPLKIDGFYFNQPENEKRLTDWAEALLKAFI